MIDSTGYKIFVIEDHIKNDSLFSSISPRLQTQKYLVSTYDLSEPNDYKKLLNNASYLGLSQFLVTPSLFGELIEKLKAYDFNLKGITFSPPINAEDQEYINEYLQNITSFYSEEQVIQYLKVLKDEIIRFDEIYDSIPEKLVFSKNGNIYIIFNNGVLFIEEDDQLIELDRVLNSLIYGVS
ncbi:hypothetical protein [Brevibacillus dissolubilis]|uniref:hypothetical protein n=1 Tax=Brevibacillus dissolubilis TaxID=1844116 RepID=UPI0011165EFB|nr:hypothetical protein [Brevibacillus dissolubilis]